MISTCSFIYLIDCRIEIAVDLNVVDQKADFLSYRFPRWFYVVLRFHGALYAFVKHEVVLPNLFNRSLHHVHALCVRICLVSLRSILLAALLNSIIIIIGLTDDTFHFWADGRVVKAPALGSISRSLVRKSVGVSSKSHE